MNGVVMRRVVGGENQHFRAMLEEERSKITPFSTG